ncbi:helix-turn-helix domain-containing protein [Selenomonas ruminis]|uniref:helix-turn-helix domain-containing protein n=1 Tax=Selenomonas ruminis TaxID=2593411 RepID=UPI0034E1F5A3
MEDGKIGQSFEHFVNSLIDNILADCETSALSREKRIAKIRIMDTRGIFQLKGSIEQVAERLGVNKVTVYSYLDEVRGKR